MMKATTSLMELLQSSMESILDERRLTEEQMAVTDMLTQRSRQLQHTCESVVAQREEGKMLLRNRSRLSHPQRWLIEDDIMVCLRTQSKQSKTAIISYEQYIEKLIEQLDQLATCENIVTRELERKQEGLDTDEAALRLESPLCESQQTDSESPLSPLSTLNHDMWEQHVQRLIERCSDCIANGDAMRQKESETRSEHIASEAASVSLPGPPCFLGFTLPRAPCMPPGPCTPTSAPLCPP